MPFARLSRASLLAATLMATASAPALLAAEPVKAAPGAAKPKVVYTDAADPEMPADFKIQGEYVLADGSYNCGEVIALGSGAFQAVVHWGGLPGAGWDGKAKILLDGKLEGDKAVFTAAGDKTAAGKGRQYLAQAPAEFLATRKPAPAGGAGSIKDGVFDLHLPASGKVTLHLKRVERKSPTLGAKAPEGAVVLFDGSSKAEWKGGRLDEKTKLLNTDGNDITTVRKFTNYTAHVEFMLPYRPEGRGQGRGNSGFYQVDLYEVQILDSFGLDGLNNECGGVYTLSEPSVNMCLPPLQWQAYDVEFASAVAGADGKKAKNAKLTVKLNGVAVQDGVELKGKTGGARNEPEGTPGPLKLQGHGNPLQFRNIWVVEAK